FAGSFTLKAVEAVCPDRGLRIADRGFPTGPSPIANPQSAIRNQEVLDLLAQLVDKSLVVAAAQDAPARYRLLETVRQYARERLRESGEESVRGRHLAYYLRLAEEAAPYLDAADKDVG